MKPQPPSSPPTLEIDNLTVGYGNHRVVRDVSLRIQPGEVYGLVGESGSGKTTLALASLGYLPAEGTLWQGSVRLAGANILGLGRRALQAIWGRRVAFVPQDPGTALNPSLRIDTQLREALLLDTADKQQRVIELLRMVRLADPERVARSYPHQLSGGMQQRVMIAMALAPEPELLVLDEPTTGLDATTEAAVLDLFRELLRAGGTAGLYISHNLGVVAQFADRAGVLYAGELAEEAPTAELFRRPLHPYTQGLLDSLPRLGENRSEIQLRPIPGQLPTLEEWPAGCVFAPRCPLAIDRCWEQRPSLESASAARRVRCHRWAEILQGAADPHQPASELPISPKTADETLLRLQAVEAGYPLSRGLAQWLRGGPRPELPALRGVDLELRRGETLGIVGESGSGKSTLALAVVGLVEPLRGRIELLGSLMPGKLTRRSPDQLRRIRMLFQHPDSSLNPHRRVGDILRRTLQTQMRLSAQQAAERVVPLLETVKLGAAHRDRFPAQLSAGEKQRVAIARAFAADPELVLLDEPVSALDVSVQASILNLLSSIQAREGASLVLISHDIAVVGYLADQVAVLYLGDLMQIASADSIFEPPYHPYTEALLAAAPRLDPQAWQPHLRLEGELPSPLEPPAGCPFHTRCPRSIGEICAQRAPPWQPAGPSKRIYCHIPAEELRSLQAGAFDVQKPRQ